MVVELRDTESFADFKIRTFKIAKVAYFYNLSVVALACLFAVCAVYDMCVLPIESFQSARSDVCLHDAVP
jgi:hypothetical protein